MHSTALPSLTVDEIDDLLYFTRVNEAQELERTISELSKKYQTTPGHVLEACVDPENGNTVLHYCSANGFSELLPALLTALNHENAQATSEKISFINHANKEGNTPLHWASYNGHMAVVKLLVTAGADMWVKNAAGHLAMFEAERAEKSEVVQYLLEAGGKDVEKAGREGQASAEDVAEVEVGPSDRNQQATAEPDATSSSG